MDKISGHELNKFHFWELQNIHDMHLVKAIVDKRIGKGNFTLDKMQEYSDEYDCFVDSIKKIGMKNIKIVYSTIWLFYTGMEILF